MPPYTILGLHPTTFGSLLLAGVIAYVELRHQARQKKSRGRVKGHG